MKEEKVVLVAEVDDMRKAVVEYVRQWGGSASDALLDSTCTIFSTPVVEGYIGYRVELGCAIVYGDPVCNPKDIPLLVEAFQKFCKEKKLEIVFVTASGNFAKWSLKNGFGVIVEFGTELVMDPHDDPRSKKGTRASLVRRKVRHAINEGVSVKEYCLEEGNKKLESAIEQVGVAWLKGRAGPQIYISHVRLFSDKVGKRWFYALKGDKVIGVVLLNQLKARQGWLINRLMFTPDAPGGTPESLIVTALDTLAKEGCHFVTFGAVPGEQLGEIVGPSKIAQWVIRKTFKVVNRFFKLKGKRGFWGKFHPKEEQSYLVFSQSYLGLRSILGLMQGLNVRLKKRQIE